MKKSNIYAFINNTWVKSILITILITDLYTLMEWVFFATKPSFMSAMSIIQKLQTLILTSFILTIPAILTVTLMWLGNRVLRIFIRSNFKSLGTIPSAVIAASLGLILIDNFTYTVFGLGIVSTSGIFRSIYAVLFLALFTASFRTIYKYIRSSNMPSLQSVYFVLIFLTLSTITFITQIPNSQILNRLDIRQKPSELPNIILLGLDGVNAENMSVYGYERDTTPNIKSLAQDALIAENAFSNSGNTGGSLTSILTGKLPTETRVIYPPDILTGEDAYQHLPGILKQAGYYTVQVTMPNFGDAYDRNIKEGFDVANFRTESMSPLAARFERVGGSGFYFSALIVQRITERLKHAFFIKQMDNPFETVTEPTKQITEKQRFETMLSYLNNEDVPTFIHVHMLGTHGPIFAPQKNVFSQGEEQNQSWMVDFYDDAILDADKYVGDLFNFLSETGTLNNTIIIIYSDHGMLWDPRNRVPLIMWFPNNEYSGKIRGNVQLIDIAPTILDYLKIQQPSWMHGQSVLTSNFPSNREVISASTSADVVTNGKDGWTVDTNKISPPFYQLGTVDLIICNKWYSLNLRKPSITYGKVIGSTAVCDENEIISPGEAKERILQNLKDDGYDISSFPKEIPVTPKDINLNSTAEKIQTTTKPFNVPREHLATGWNHIIDYE